MISHAQCLRLCRALLAAELDRQPGRARPEGPAALWPETLSIDEEGAGLDSLARLALVKEMTERFGLDRTGVDDYLLVNRSLGEWAELLAEHFRRIAGDHSIGFRTSGTTGPAKPVRHGLAQLVEEIDALWGTAIAADRQRIVTLVPPQHIYGFLFTVLLPSRTGLPVLDLWGQVPSAALRKTDDGDLIVANPHLWDLALSPEATSAGAPHGLTSTDAAPAELWPRAARAGVARLTEIYGASETGGIGTRQDPADAYGLMPHLTRVGDRITAPGRALPLQDDLVWDGPRQFRLAGRRDGAVLIAGHTIQPEEVAATLHAVAGVAEVAVAPAAGRLEARVTLGPEAPDLATLEEHLRTAAAALPAAARPVAYLFSAPAAGAAAEPHGA